MGGGWIPAYAGKNGGGAGIREAERDSSRASDDGRGEL